MKNSIKLISSAMTMIMLCSAMLSAQTPAAQKGKPDTKEEKKGVIKVTPQNMPPYYLEFRKANSIADPQMKLDALEKILKNFPKAGNDFLFDVNVAILRTMAKTWPDQKEKLLAQTRRAVSKLPADNKADALNDLAGALLDAGVLLNEAQSYGEKGLAALNEKEYVDSQKKLFENMKRTPPSDAELSTSFRSMRAENLSVLGRIHLKKGESAEAEKYLKEAYEANPTVPGAAVSLAEINEKAGNEKAALDYLATALLGGRVKKQDREKFQTLYRKTHNNSLDGMDALLDERYKQIFPLPFHVDHYEPTAARSKRVVLAEVFTGAACPPCVAADLGFDAVMERYSRDEVAVLMYHQHIPQADPLTNPATQKRYNFYGGGGVPNYVIDGQKDGGGGPRMMTRAFYDRVNPLIEKELEVAPDADIKLDAVMDGSIIKVKASVENVKGSAGPVKLQIALMEDLLRYSGENGIRFHPMVVRALAGQNADGFVVDVAAPAAFEHTFDISKIVEGIKAHLESYEANRNKDLPPDSPDKFAFAEKKHEIDSGKLSVVAFVQDEKTKKILQAVYIKPKAGEVSASK